MRGHRDDNNYDNDRNGNYIIRSMQSLLSSVFVQLCSRLKVATNY